MAEPTLPPDLSARLAQLSPERRALLERALRAQRPAEGSAAAAPVGAAEAGIPRRVDGARAPLMPMQRFVWELSKAVPGLHAYNAPRAYRIDGPLDLDALQSALDALIVRHEVYRTRIVETDGDAEQRIDPPRAVSVTLHDLRAVPDARRSAAVDEALRQGARAPFALERELLLRAELLRVAEAQHVLLLVSHHIASDDWSRNVMFRELSELYAAFAEGRAPTLAPVAVQYGDVAAWLADAQSGATMTAHMRHWVERLDGAPEQLTLPFDHPRGTTPQFVGRRINAVVEREVVDALRRVALGAKGSLFSAILAAHAAFLSRITGQQDLVIGVPVAGRAHPDLDGVIGYLTNTLPIRVTIEGAPTFAELVASTHAACLDGYEHQDLPFETLASEVQRRRGGASPVFQTLCTLHDQAPVALTLGRLQVTPVGFEAGWVKLDLALDAATRPDGTLQLTMGARADLFEADTIERLLAHFVTMLRGIAADPQARIDALPLLTAPESEQLVVGWNATARAFPGPDTLHGRILAAAHATPEAIALEWEDQATVVRRMSFGELVARAAALQPLLRSVGAGPGVGVGVCVERSPELVVSMLAAMMAGSHYVPFDPAYPTERLTFMLDDAAVPVLLVHGATRAAVEAFTAASAHAVRIVDLDQPLPSAKASLKAKASAAAKEATASDLAYVIYTSGSTGRPKGVMIPHSAVVNYLAWMQAQYPMAASDAVLQKAPASFDACIWEFFLPLVSGARMVLARPGGHQDPEYLLAALARHAITVLQLVPVQFRMLLEVPNANLGVSMGGLRRLFFGGEALPGDLLGAVRAHLPALAVTNLYGPTEATVYATAWDAPVGTWRGATVPVGKPIANARVYIVERSGAPAPVGVAGELLIGGVGLARGYHEREALTAEKFIADPFASEPGARAYRTGDMACFAADGTIEYLGRLDEQVKVRGHRIELGEIEAVLMATKFVKQAVVIARREPGAEARLVGYVVPIDASAAHGALRDALTMAMRTALPDFMVPSALMVLDTMPTTPAGKVNRLVLPAPDHDAVATRAFVAPRTEREREIAAVWADVLGVDAVGVDDDFFALGGHSLLAVRVIGRLASKLPVRLTIGQLFEARTVAALAAMVDASRAAPTVAEDGPRALVAVARRVVQRGSAVSPELAELVSRHGPVAVMPVSFAQRRFWILDQLEGGASAYTVPQALRLEGMLDVEALQAALRKVVERHEALRTVFALDGDEPVQVIMPSLDVALVVEELSPLEAPARAAAVLARAEANANAPFDLRTGPLLRSSLLRLSPREHVLLLAVHHIVFDGLSNAVMLREIAAAYDAQVGAHASALPVLAVQYADFAAWQRDEADEAAAARHLAWWAERLRDVPALDLPVDRARPAVLSPRGAKRDLLLGAELAERIRALARRDGATPFMAFLSAFATLLARYSGQVDFAVGSISAGRSDPALEPLVGLFLNTLALRLDLSGDPAFTDLLARVRREALAALAHEQVPFEQVVDAVQPARDRSRSPLFQVAFQYAEGSAEERPLAGLAVSRVRGAKETSKFDVTLSLTPASGGALRAAIEFSTDLFDAATIDRMLGHYAVLLASIAQEPACAISRLPMLDAAERSLVIEHWNHTAAPIPSWSAPERIVALARATPDAVAIESTGEQLTWRDLDARSARVADRLRRAGVQRGDRVAVMVGRSSLLPVALLGAWRAGAAYVPLDATYPAARITQVLEDAGAVAIVVDATARTEAAEALMLATVPVIEFAPSDWKAPLADAASVVDARPAADDVAYVIFTSGSTGRPKGVAVPHGALTNFLASMAERPGLGVGDAVVAVTTIAFDIAGLELWLPLTTGARVVLATREVAADGDALRALVASTAATSRRTLLQATPATWRLLLETAWSGTPNLVMLCGGEGWPDGLAQSLLARGLELWNVYGPTETTIWSARARVTTPVLSLGEPLANTTLFVLEPSREPAPLGVPGELWIGGAGLAHGYLGRPDLTAERFVEVGAFGRLYRTGDRVRRLADGRLEFLGRLDDQVKVRGYRIELAEIEHALTSAPSVLQAAVTVHRSDAGDARIVGYIVARGDVQPAMAAAREAARRLLPEYMVPSVVVALDALPLTPNGKVNRRALPAPDADAAVETPYAAPRTALEAEIAATWANVLGRERVGVDDDFFALGGHSLLAMRVIARLAQAHPVRLTIGAMFEARTVAGLAALVEARVRAASPGERAFAAVAELDEAPLSHTQQPLWLFEQMQPGTATYHVTIVRRLRGPVRVDALEQALEAVVATHASLRTAFSERDGTGWQHVRPTVSVPFERHDVRALAGPEREAAARARVTACATQPFDLTRAPLVRACVVQIADDDVIIALVLHHIICDGGSVGVLLHDWSEAYAQLCRGERPALRSPALQMTGYAAWERETIDGDRLEAGTAYWRETLHGASSAIELPTDAPRTATRWGPGARVTSTLAPAAVEAVARLARAHGVSPYMVFLAAFEATLHRYTGQETIVVGSPSAQRDRPELERLVGCLVSTVLLRADFDADTTFAQLLAQVRMRTLGALDHAFVPSDRLASILREGDGHGDEGLFDVLFAMQEGTGEGERFADLAMERVGGDLAVARFDLSLMLTTAAGRTRLALDYRADLFDAESMTALVAHFGELLAHACAEPATPVSQLRLLGPGARAAVLALGDGGTLAYNTDTSMGALVEAQAQATPDAIAVRCGNERLTYRELDSRSRALAAELLDRGVQRETRVGLCASRRADLVVGMLAVLRAGGAYVPLDPGYPEERLRVILEDAQAPILLAEAGTAATLRRLLGATGSSAPVIIELDAPRDATYRALPRVHGRDLGYVIYTSGSTGRPKGVAIEHRSAVAMIAWAHGVYTAEQLARVIACTSICFDLSVFEIFVTLARGGTVVLVDDALAVRDLPPDAAPTLLNTVPSAAAALLAMGGIPASVSTINLAGEPLLQEVVERLYALPHVQDVFDLYGPSEDTTYSTYTRRVPGGRANIGRPIANTQAYVLDESQKLLPANVPGELYLGGDGLARGYLGRQDLTDERFMRNPFAEEHQRPASDRLYRSGDRVRWLKDGTLQYLGRLDHQVKLRGFRIEMGEVEGALRRLPGVRQAVAMVRTDARGEQRLVAYVEAMPGAPLPEPSALLLGCSAALPAYMVPAAFVVMPELPLTPNGKLDRKALKAPSQFASARASLPPRTDVERVVAHVWAEVLGGPIESVEATFTELGGHSLLATRVAAQVGKLFRTAISLRLFFETPTVVGLARALAVLEAKPGQAALIAATILKVQQMSPEERERLRRPVAAVATPTGSAS